MLGEDDAVEAHVFHPPDERHTFSVKPLAQLSIPHPAGHGVRHGPVDVRVICHALPYPNFHQLHLVESPAEHYRAEAWPTGGRYYNPRIRVQRRLREEPR